MVTIGLSLFQIGLVVLIQYRCDRQPPSHPPSHIAVAITLNAKASSLKTSFCGMDVLNWRSSSIRRQYNTTLDPSDVRRPSSLGPSTQRARVCLYVTLINNTVDVVSFPSIVQFILHTAATVVWNYSYVTEMAPGQKRHTSQARFSYAAEPRFLLCTG